MKFYVITCMESNVLGTCASKGALFSTRLQESQMMLHCPIYHVKLISFL